MEFVRVVELNYITTICHINVFDTNVCEVVSVSEMVASTGNLGKHSENAL
jgi:hypothetical protein